ncbi:uncharacterized protein A4U43_C05F13130 [Asparagus officinalis]|uniref:Uncharacterized protein n=1 Tax=Asparagus officinalis TaxID=4686 RepID=A0A5P1EWQ0_ASPOF|nr:uncharacterized protein A4U43_C05F13130 [Asparagus officinalis]
MRAREGGAWRRVGSGRGAAEVGLGGRPEEGAWREERGGEVGGRSEDGVRRGGRAAVGGRGEAGRGGSEGVGGRPEEGVGSGVGRGRSERDSFGECVSSAIQEFIEKTNAIEDDKPYRKDGVALFRVTFWTSINMPSNSS